MRQYTLFIEDYHCHFQIGVPEEERQAPQRLAFDVELLLAEQTNRLDTLHSSVDYSEVVRLIDHFSQQAPYVLVETLANDLADKCFEEFTHLTSITIRVRKLDIIDAAKAVGVTLRQTRPSA